MSEREDGPASYVRRVQAGARRQAQELLDENERLRGLLAAYEAERAALDPRLKALEDLARLTESLQGLTRTLEQDRSRLSGELAQAERECERLRRQQDEVERQSSNLANLYVASYRLHGAGSRQEVLATIQEIIANLVGSEQVGVFERSGDELRLVASFGVDPAVYARVPLAAGRIGRAAAEGAVELLGVGPHADAAPGEEDLTACVPLKLGTRVAGMIAVFRLLPQKAAFAELDRELFELLATQAAGALRASTLAEPMVAAAP